MQTVDEISEVINAIRQISNVGVCYYDLDNFFNYDRFGVKNNIGHYCRFCEKARGLKNGRARCTQSDRYDAMELASQYKEPFFFECHMGIRELIVPLKNDDKLIGALFVGQCRIEGEDGRKTVMQNTKQAGGSEEEFLQAYEELPEVKRDVMLSIGKLLKAYFSAKILSNELLPLGSNEDEGTLVERMKKYIDAHYNFDLTLQKVAQVFFISPSYASRLFSSTYNQTMNNYINSLKIKKAELLLSSTSAPISNVAINSGFTDANYFSRLFKKHTKLTPQEYRAKHRF